MPNTPEVSLLPPICHLTLSRASPNAATFCIGSECSAWDPASPASSNLGRCGLNPSKDRKAWLDPVSTEAR